MTSLHAPLAMGQDGIESLRCALQLPSPEPHEAHEGGEPLVAAELFQAGWGQLAVIREQMANGR